MAAAVVPLIFDRTTMDIFATPKSTVLAVAGLLSVLTWMGATSLARCVRIPEGWGPRAAMLVGVVVLLSVGTSDAPVLSISGSYSRYTGAASYLAAVVLFLAVAHAFDRTDVRRLGVLLVATSVVVSIYAIVQWGGLDPYDWGDNPDWVVSTLGNPNFLSAQSAVSIPLALWALLHWWNDPPRRLAAGAVGLLSVLSLVAAGSLQGGLAATVGVGTLGSCFAATRSPQVRRLVVVTWVAAIATTAGFVFLGVRGVGPVAVLLAQRSVGLRVYYWEAATSMFRDAPLLGVGIGRFSEHFRAHRSLEAASEVALFQGSDAVHNVPLEFFATTGVFGGSAYLLFVLTIGVAFVRAVPRTNGSDRQLLAGFGGAWAATQVISMVSVDVAPMLLLHVLCAGALWVLSGSGRELVWPSGPRDRPARWEAPRSPASIAVVAGLGAVLAVGLVTVTSVWRADRNAVQAAIAEARGEAPLALEQSAAAVDRAAWMPRFSMLEAQTAATFGDDERELLAYERAVDADWRRFDAHLGLARSLVADGRLELALQHFETALEIEPSHPKLRVIVAEHLGSMGRESDAKDLLDTVLSDLPEYEPAHEVLDEYSD